MESYALSAFLLQSTIIQILVGCTLQFSDKAYSCFMCLKPFRVDHRLIE
jgi:hypothetical protein